MNATPPYSGVAELVRRCYAAYETKNRAALKQLLSDDFQNETIHYATQGPQRDDPL